MQNDTGVEQDVEKIFDSLEQSQQKIADKWSDVMRTTARPSQADATEAILQAQNEIMRIALRWMDPANGFAALASNWLTLPRSLAATTLELQRRTLEAWTKRDELRPEAIAQRWSGPWLDTMRAHQEAAARMVEIQSAWMRSFASQLGTDERGEPARPRASTPRGRARNPSKQRRRAGNGRKGSQAQRAH